MHTSPRAAQALPDLFAFPTPAPDRAGVCVCAGMTAMQSRRFPRAIGAGMSSTRHGWTACAAASEKGRGMGECVGGSDVIAVIISVDL
jgi:hypothetical protein